MLVELLLLFFVRRRQTKEFELLIFFSILFQSLIILFGNEGHFLLIFALQVENFVGRNIFLTLYQHTRFVFRLFYTPAGQHGSASY